MMGLHPTSVDSNYIDILKQTESYLSKRTYCGIGEIGIDLYWDKTYLKEQQIVFEEQLRWSIDLNLPVAIHTRDAYPEVLECIHKVGAERLKGVFHSFTGTTEELEEIKKLPTFKIGINGVVTFKNSKLSEVIRQTDLKRYSWKQMHPIFHQSPTEVDGMSLLTYGRRPRKWRKHSASR